DSVVKKCRMSSERVQVTSCWCAELVRLYLKICVRMATG
ncbi:hypothetical protein A2U01_0069327, partial [Trifolium medium]|nr:hypothetical protein [Trifolium medium]